MSNASLAETTPATGKGHAGAIVAATLAAIIPTLLSAEGMVLVAHDALRLPIEVAIGLAAFLEVALVASALLARAAVRRGSSARADSTATWILSAVSGALSASHEVVGPDGHWHAVDARTLLAIAVRLTAPLVAAWLWHRVLIADRDVADPRPTRSQARRSRLMLSVAEAAATVARTEPGTQGHARAEQELRARQVKLLSHVPATDARLDSELDRWLHVVSAVDTMPLRTIARSDDPFLPEPPAAVVPEAVDRELAGATAMLRTEPVPAGPAAPAAQPDAQRPGREEAPARAADAAEPEEETLAQAAPLEAPGEPGTPRPAAGAPQADSLPADAQETEDGQAGDEPGPGDDDPSDDDPSDTDPSDTDPTDPTDPGPGDRPEDDAAQDADAQDDTDAQDAEQADEPEAAEPDAPEEAEEAPAAAPGTQRPAAGLSRSEIVELRVDLTRKLLAKNPHATGTELLRVWAQAGVPADQSTARRYLARYRPPALKLAAS